MQASHELACPFTDAIIYIYIYLFYSIFSTVLYIGSFSLGREREIERDKERNIEV